jgi:hypothetical protein
VSEAVRQLESLVGEWSIAGGVGAASFEWLEGGRFLIQRWRSEPPEFPDGIAIFGEDAESGSLVQHYFDSRGVARRYGTSLEDGVWKLWRDDPDFAQRFSGTLSADGSEISGAWEIAKDRVTWEHDFDITFRRVERG